MTTYYKLKDKLHKDYIIKANDDLSNFLYLYGTGEWQETALFGHYTYLDDALCGEYEEISQAEAEKIIKVKDVEYLALKEKAIKIATEAHRKQLDKGGIDNINQQLKVAENVQKKRKSIEYFIAAILYDVLNNKNITLDNLKNDGFPENIIYSLKFLMKPKSLNYQKYIERVKKNSIAKAVKIEYLKYAVLFNDNLSNKDCKQIEKYKKTLEFLES